MKKTIRLTESELKRVIKNVLKEAAIPRYEQPVCINCSSEEDADAEVELGYSDYASSRFFVGECGTDGYAALEAVVSYLEKNNIIEPFEYSIDEINDSYDGNTDDFVEVNGHFLPSWLMHIKPLCDNHGGRLNLNEAITRAIRKYLR